MKKWEKLRLDDRNQIRIAWGGSGYSPESSWSVEMCYIFVGVLVTPVNTFAKTHGLHIQNLCILLYGN